MFTPPSSQSLDANESTSRTLLERVRLLEPEAWQRFVVLYGPVIYAWAERAGLQPNDAADVTQEVFQAISGSINKFRRERPNDSFRGWLRTIAANKIRDHFRRQKNQTTGQDGIDDIPAPDPATFDSDPRPISELAQRALALIQTEFETSTAKAFLLCTVSGMTPQQAAAELGLTVAAVYKAKSRVLNRLRRELDGLLD